MKPLIIANWKCNPTTLREAKRIFGATEKGVKDIKNCEVVICSPFPYILHLKPYTLNLTLGAQNCFYEDEGAFTGEISPKMLKNLGCKYVILGHSERRKYQKETDEMVNKKLKAALGAGLTPILCIDKISQIKKGPKGILNLESKTLNLIIAYEPLFAIGTGKPCSPERAGKMREEIEKVAGKNAKILYGGSVNSENAADYIKAGFDGVLVGGASLNSKEFIALVKNLNIKI